MNSSEWAEMFDYDIEQLKSALADMKDEKEMLAHDIRAIIDAIWELEHAEGKEETA